MITREAFEAPLITLQVLALTFVSIFMQWFTLANRFGADIGSDSASRALIDSAPAAGNDALLKCIAEEPCLTMSVLL